MELCQATRTQLTDKGRDALAAWLAQPAASHFRPVRSACLSAFCARRAEPAAHERLVWHAYEWKLYVADMTRQRLLTSAAQRRLTAFAGLR